MSRNGHTFEHWPYLNVELAHAIRCETAVLDGEIVCFDDTGRPNFHKLLFRRDWPVFCAFDVLMLNGRDLRQLPLVERKARLKVIMPRVQSRVRCVDHIARTGSEFYRLVCERDLEGIVAKWKRGHVSD
jgi:bifunctional non-homologous end joining protein LigD